MYFVELTKRIDKKKIMVNVKNIRYFETIGKDIYGNIINGSNIFYSNGDFVQVLETYQEIIDMMKRLNSVSCGTL